MTVTIVIAAFVLMLAVLVAIMGAALVEVFRQLRDLRRALDLDDRPQPLETREQNLTFRDLALPTVVGDLPETVAIVLSVRCATCTAIADAFRAGAPRTAWFILVQPDSDERTHLQEALDACSDQAIIDIDGRLMQRIGLNITPVAISMEFGDVTRVHSVTSAKQIQSLVPSAPRAGSSASAADSPLRKSRPLVKQARS